MALLDFDRDFLGEAAPERWLESETSLDLLEQEIVSGMASAGLYANLYVDPDT